MNFQTRLDKAIEEKGFRISPRLSMEDRLARYIELSANARGDSVTTEESHAAATMILMETNDKCSCSDDSMENETPRRSQRLRNRAAFMEPMRTVSETTSGMRVTLNTGAHPMVRRSQVSRR